MKLRKSHTSGSDKVELQMTAMIDIVFQLLAFFVMTFKIVEVEGDFNIKMPVAASAASVTEDPFPPIKVVLRAGSNGGLAQIVADGRVLYAGGGDGGNLPAGFYNLHMHIMRLVGQNPAPGSPSANAEVELDCDYNLHYDNVIRAVTAVTGGVDPNGTIYKLVERVKFAPPKAPQ